MYKEFLVFVMLGIVTLHGVVPRVIWVIRRSNG